MLNLFVISLLSLLVYYKTELLQPLKEHYYYSQQYQSLLNQIQLNSGVSKLSGDWKSHKLATNSYFYDDYLNQLKNYYDPPSAELENATILMLVRNWELDGALLSMRSLEDRFNKNYNYPWVFLNDVPFTEEFKEATTLMASGNTFYGLVSSEDWDRPLWVNSTRFEENLNQSEAAGVLYGNSRSYRNMCRFNSGKFYKQPLLDLYDWYFRVEPNVEYYCDFQYDPFKYLRTNNKTYGFVIALYEYENTIPSLWNTTMDFCKHYPQHVHANNSYEFLTDTLAIGDKIWAMTLGSDYNLCHFWSNFEIASLEFFRSKKYNDFFDYLDKSGGFYYERWGDAPVHSIGLGLLEDKNKLHHFEDIGYSHLPFDSCPVSTTLRYAKRCICDASHESNIDLKLHSCLKRWWKKGAGKRFLRGQFE